jgi:sec-independent protein translocase protein TatA
MAEDDEAETPAKPTRIEGKPAPTPDASFQTEAERTREER